MTESAVLQKSRQDTIRLLAIAVYVLYLMALPLGITAIVGVIIAYVKRDEARGTVFESHFSSAIETFWVFFAVMLVAVPLCFILVGIPVVVILYVWMLVRTVKGLVRAASDQAY